MATGALYLRGVRHRKSMLVQEGCKMEAAWLHKSAIAERSGSEHKSPSGGTQIIFQMLVICLLLLLLLIDYKGA